MKDQLKKTLHSNLVSFSLVSRLKGMRDYDTLAKQQMEA